MSNISLATDMFENHSTHLMQFPDSTTIFGRALRWPLKLAPRGRSVRIVTGPLAGARWIIGNGPHGYWLGTYERQLQSQFRRFVADGTTVLDVGANLGFYSLLAARLVGTRGRVISIEPTPPTIARLRNHLSLNAELAALITTIEAAVGDHEGVATISFAHDPASASIHSLDTPSASYNVPLITLDALYDAGQIVGEVSLVKIDVEGAEMDVLRGAQKLIESQRPTILISCHSAALHAAVAGWLGDRNYGSSSLRGDSPELTKPADLLARPLER